LRQRLPAKKILVLDTNEDANEIIRLLSMGVHGYILKQCDHQEIIDAVNTILQGKNFFCSNVLKLNKTPVKSLSQVDTDSTVRLSAREIEILELISQGLTNNEIADKTFISAHTVASHRKNLMKKFSARNNVDLVISAIKENFIAF
jgi:DNA-binding NarL/FixJ family response regulator